MTNPERDALIESVVTPYRERDLEGHVLPPPGWWDLSEADREELDRRQAESRAIEKATHPLGFSGTVRAVLARIERMR